MEHLVPVSIHLIHLKWFSKTVNSSTQIQTNVIVGVHVLSDSLDITRACMIAIAHYVFCFVLFLTNKASGILLTL